MELKIGLWNGWTFMSVFILQMLVMMFADKNAQQRTQIPPGARRNRFERNINLIANLVWLLALIISIFLPLQLKTGWFAGGLSVFILGVIFLVAASRSFITAPGEAPITSGVYRISRHPMYLATFLISLGTGIATASWTFILLSVLMALCFWQEALIEERICLEQYGSEYWEYMQSVPRWLGVPK